MDDELSKQFYVGLIKQAREGNTDDAAILLKEFVSLENERHESPLIDYIASCLGVWIDTGLDPNSAADCFNVSRANHRPQEWRIAERHIDGFRAYYLMRGRGKGRDPAIKIGGIKAGISFKAFKKLLEDKSDDIDTRRETAKYLIRQKNRKVFERCMNPPRKRHSRR